MQSFLETQPQSLAELPTVDAALQAFRDHILEYRRTLNNEGIWLFLSTVGCWGVPQPVYQFLAYGLTIVLFGSRLNGRHKEKKSFTKISEQLLGRIDLETAEASDRARQHLFLQQIKAQQLSSWNSVREGYVFLLCWFFYGASFAYALLHLGRSGA